jgi:hypothetical protein
MYGLIDAPLLWQLCLRYVLIKELQATSSLFDENFYFWKTTSNQITQAMTTHVDDTLATASQHLLDKLRAALELRFGEMKRQCLPFSHIGLSYIKTNTGLFIHQAEFCNNLKVHKLTRERAKQTTAAVTEEERTALRSGAGGLMYLIQTRSELASDLLTLMTKINSATVAELKFMNAIITRAKKFPKRGIYIHKIDPPYRLLAWSDASHASSKTVYAFEGQLCLLASDRGAHRLPSKQTDLTSAQMHDLLGGKTQFIEYVSRKSKRVSHSTSHAESLSSHGSLASAELVASRFTELYSPYPMTPDRMIQHEASLPAELPIDLIGDAKDVLDLVTGERGVPLDTAQRVIILSLRERRLLRKLRHMYLVSTKDMLANRLTKYDPSDPCLEKFLDTGIVSINHPGLLRPAVKRAKQLSEDEIIHYKAQNEEES